MCSIAIPGGDLLLGHSPPAYGSLLYSSLMVTTPPIASRSLPPQIRPCLASASLNLDGLIKGGDDGADAVGGRRHKKRVVFADDRGRPLTQVRVMSEPSNMPPIWTSAYMAKLSHGSIFGHFDGSFNFNDQPSHRTSTNFTNSSSARQPSRSEGASTTTTTNTNGTDSEKCGRRHDRWEPCFAQPASDYLAFRGKLDRGSVSLENVIVRESEGCLVGTVKVKNLAYAKEVTIRASTDDWSSHRDYGCEYVELPASGAGTAAAPVRNLYDTFRFRMPLPTEAEEQGAPDQCSEAGQQRPRRGHQRRQIEFCVRYRTEGAEFWDNNAGANYVVRQKRDVTLEEQIAELLSACCGPSSAHSGFAEGSASRRHQAPPYATTTTHGANKAGDEATRMELRTWSEFASWQHLDNDNAPYW